MKNYFKALFILSLTLFFFGQGFGQIAAKGTSENSTSVSAVQCKYVDNNNNGICDNHELKGKDSQCANFIDKDGNGICDNCGKNANAGQGATCQGHKEGMGCGQAKAGCGANCKSQGTDRGKCCANQQVTPNVNPTENTNPKK
jgi:hypothetical protein